MTPAAGTGATAPWITRQLGELAARLGHAWLIHGPSGLGQLELGLALARAWLCEAPNGTGSCARCASCRQMDAKAHLDLLVLLPEALALELGWPLDEKAQDEINGKKRKPSREIKVDAARGMVDFAQLTRSGQRCKVVLVYPAERMNQVTANTILKTLEEPPGESRFILCSDAAHQLLPTIRSRCQLHTMRWPEEAESVQWLTAQGVLDKEAGALLKLAGGRPELALRYHAAGRSAAVWCQLPDALLRGQASVFDDIGLADMVDALQKLCHDQMALCVGAPPRYFPHEALSRRPPLSALKRWSMELRDSARIVEHPMAVGLMAESLVCQAGRALNSPGP
jgi:DNA polymerase-3 subunit delta'